MAPKLADAVQQVGTYVFRSPTAIVMHPRRWAWICAGLDTTPPAPLRAPMSCNAARGSASPSLTAKANSRRSRPSLSARHLSFPRAHFTMHDTSETATQPHHAVDTTIVERRAVDAVLAAERRLGRSPQEMPRNHPGYDIRGTSRDGTISFIEVRDASKEQPHSP